ncbi:MAG: putative 2OG-Fe(II) oxygenase [Pseudomonadota bacterium]|uniref:TPR domain protein n=1 Tax=hydrothermal vent metagenome TaxID=652676 RepID=A0A160TS23_9ZZZZ
MIFSSRLAAAQLGQADASSLAELAELALGEGEEEQVLPLLIRAAAQGANAQLWQWTGLLQRALDEHAAASRSFVQAARLAPAVASIAHGRAHVALEAGLDSVALFEQARRLAPANGDVLLGLAAARLAAGRGEQAAAELQAILDREPRWIHGHLQLGQIQSMLGRPERATHSLDQALKRLPGERALWQGLFDLHVRSENYAGLQVALQRAGKAGHGQDARAEYEAIAAAELGEDDTATVLFDSAPASARPRLAVWRVRHLLRSGRAADAVTLIDRELATERAAAMWPYAAAAWRLTGDPRSAWLENSPDLVAVVDLGPALPALERLADRLRSLHVAKGQYLDQSVRGGTQTDGPLLSRIDPEIRAMRAAIEQAVARYVAHLPPLDARHPLLGARRDRRIRFTGSWSVRLRGGGFHANHVHPQGWISSALYIALPARRPDENAQAGWLALGEPQAALKLDLAPSRLIEPRAGRLVLFPSWMWHGTLPFADGERLTVAFDVAPPR